MITVIYGAKGTGKTKQILQQANDAVAAAKGIIVYVTDNNEHMFQLKRPIRYVAAAEYNLTSLDTFIGFIKGMSAVNHDIESIYIDGAARIAKADISTLGPLFEVLEEHDEIKFVLTVSSAKDNLPDFIKKYVK